MVGMGKICRTVDSSDGRHGEGENPPEKRRQELVPESLELRGVELRQPVRVDAVRVELAVTHCYQRVHVLVPEHTTESRLHAHRVNMVT